MLGSLISFGGYTVVLGLLVLWMVIKTWRSNRLLAIVTFFFWPASVFALIRQWEDPESDIKIPFLLALVTAGAMLWSANRVVDQGMQELGAALTPAEIEAIRREDPELAAEIVATQQEARAQLSAELAQDTGSPSSTADLPLDDVIDDASQPQTATTVDPEVQRRALLRRLTANLVWQRGSVRFDDAHSTLVLPVHFRFVPAGALFALGNTFGQPIDRFTQGWIVHERMDLVDPAAWFIEVRHEPTGHLLAGGARPDDLAAEVAGTIAAGLEGPAFGVGSYAPQWYRQEALLTYAREQAATERSQMRYDVVAARPLRAGIMVFRVRGLGAGERELGLRASRLLARGLQVDAGYRHADHRESRDGPAAATLARWVASR